MVELAEYINLPEWDAHVHLIGNDEKYRIARKSIQYINWLPYDRKKSLYKMIKDTPHPGEDIIALNAIDAKEMKQVIKDESFPIIGEINIKKTYKDQEKELKTLEDHTIYDIVKNDSRPVVIHYDVEDSQDFDTIEEMAKKRKNKILLLTHAGGNYFLQNKKPVFDHIPTLMERNHNIWIDLSWCTLTWVEENPDFLRDIDTGRVLVGSDLCRDSNHMIKERKRQLKFFENRILTNENMKMFLSK